MSAPATRRGIPNIARAVRDSAMACTLAASISPAAFAATIVVANCNNGGLGSLRNAIDTAPEGSTIDLTQMSCSKITLTSGALAPVTSVTLHGPGPPSEFVIDGGKKSRLIANTGAELAIDGLSLINGYTSGAGGCILSSGNVSLKDSTVSGCTVGNSAVATGGGISVTGNLTLTRTQVKSNFCVADANYGGGIYVKGNLVMRDSTVAGNAALSLINGLHSFGGGIFAKSNVDMSGSAIINNSSGAYVRGNTFYPGNVGGLLLSSPGPATAKIVNSTVSFNFAVGNFGGIYSNAPLQLTNSTVASNTELDSGNFSIGAGVSVFNASSTFISSIVFGNRTYATGPGGNTCCYEEDVDGASMTITGSHNLIGAATVATLPPDTLSTDPLLANLASNGGLTLTQTLNVGSPAIASGSNPSGLATDQRGPGFSRVFARHVDIGAFQTGDAIFTATFEPPG